MPKVNVANTGGEGSSNANEKIEGINTDDILGPAGDEARGEQMKNMRAGASLQT